MTRASTSETMLTLSREEAESIVALSLQKQGLKRSLMLQPFFEQMITGVQEMVQSLQTLGWKIERPEGQKE